MLVFEWILTSFLFPRQDNCIFEDNEYGWLLWKIWCQRECAMLLRFVFYQFKKNLVAFFQIFVLLIYILYLLFRLFCLDALLVVWHLYYTVMNFGDYFLGPLKSSAWVMVDYSLIRIYLVTWHHLTWHSFILFIS